MDYFAEQKNKYHSNRLSSIAQTVKSRRKNSLQTIDFETCGIGPEKIFHIFGDIRNSTIIWKQIFSPNMEQLSAVSVGHALQENTGNDISILTFNEDIFSTRNPEKISYLQIPVYESGKNITSLDLVDRKNKNSLEGKMLKDITVERGASADGFVGKSITLFYKSLTDPLVRELEKYGIRIDVKDISQSFRDLTEYLLYANPAVIEDVMVSYDGKMKKYYKEGEIFKNGEKTLDIDSIRELSKKGEARVGSHTYYPFVLAAGSSKGNIMAEWGYHDPKLGNLGKCIEKSCDRCGLVVAEIIGEHELENKSVYSVPTYAFRKPKRVAEGVSHASRQIMNTDNTNVAFDTLKNYFNGN